MKNLKYIIATLFVVAIGAGIFWACEKDIDKSETLQNEKLVGTKNHKSMGNHQQPTYDININTDINIMNGVYVVVGSAEVGDYDGRIYAYDAMWTIHIAEMNEYFTLHLTATLKSEYEDLMIEVEPFIENYIITVNGINVGPDFILTVDTIGIITYASVSEFWTNIITECNENLAVNGGGGDNYRVVHNTIEDPDIYYMEGPLGTIVCALSKGDTLITDDPWGTGEIHFYSDGQLDKVICTGTGTTCGNARKMNLQTGVIKYSGIYAVSGTGMYYYTWDN